MGPDAGDHRDARPGVEDRPTVGEHGLRLAVPPDRFLQARDGVSRAAQAYGNLIQAGIQSEDVPIAGLSAWLEKMEPEGTYTVTQPTALPGGQAATLLEFNLQGQPAYY